MKVSYYLKSERIPAKGGAADTELKVRKLNPDRSIFARICYRGYKVVFYLSASINPKYWDKKTQRAKKVAAYPTHPEFNAWLDKVENTIKSTALQHALRHNNVFPSPEQLKGALRTALRPEEAARKALGFTDYLERVFIAQSKSGLRSTLRGKPITEGTITSYNVTLGALRRFEKHARKQITFDNFDVKLFNELREYFTLHEKQAVNYVAKHIKVMKTVMSFAVSQGDSSNEKHRRSDFTAVNEDSESIYLTEAELKDIQQHDFSDNKRLDRARDLFLIGCHTGLRYSDLSTLRPEHIKDGLITIRAQKTGNEVVIPVHPVVSEILEKYNGNLPAALSNQKANDAVKDVCKCIDSLKVEHTLRMTKGGVTVSDTQPKYKLVTTHTARRSFATNQFYNGVPTLTIMAITGHKTEKSFMRYIKVTPAEHAKMMAEVWSKRLAEQTAQLSTTETATHGEN